MSYQCNRSFIVNLSEHMERRTALRIFIFVYHIMQLMRINSSEMKCVTDLWVPCSWHPAPCFSERWRPNSPPCRYPSAAAPRGWEVPSPYARQHGCTLQTEPTQGITPPKGARRLTGKWMAWTRISKCKAYSAMTDTVSLDCLGIDAWINSLLENVCVCLCVHRYTNITVPSSCQLKGSEGTQRRPPEWRDLSSQPAALSTVSPPKGAITSPPLWETWRSRGWVRHRPTEQQSQCLFRF